MIQPWQAGSRMVTVIVPMGMAPLRMLPGGAFPVPESLAPQALPPAVRESVLRLLEGPPKPSVALEVMNESQRTMIGPDLPSKSNV